MIRRIPTLLICLAIPLLLRSQVLFHPDEEKGMIRGEIGRYKSLFKASDENLLADNRIDVGYYRLDLTITTAPSYLRGSVQMNAVSLVSGLTSVTLDLMNTMTVDSVKIAGLSASFVQSSSTFDITLDHAYASGEPITIVTYYRGVPGSSGFGSFEFSSHMGTPWVWTLSEPYGAKDWWPCKDHPRDKADSVDVSVTVDSAYRVGSNGKLLSVTNNGNGTSTHHWHHHYPISSYLVSVAITNYASFTNWFKWTSTDSMPVLNYVLPENLSSAQTQLPRTIDALGIYSNLFGLYPFADEKYGHSQFGWGGGMEHQTMTSLGGFSEGLVAHELAHQWFGDMITCRTWPDIWLNEGFATYLTGLYYEHRYGTSTYWGYMNSQMSSAKGAIGSIYVTDTSSVGRLFDGSLVYAKGATVLHMLRHILGDSAFFHSMWNYAHNPALRFGTASTADFQEACETYSGKDLDYFFNEWIFGEKYPSYYFYWSSTPSAGGFTVQLKIGQTTGTSNPSFFTMPIDVKLSASGWDTTVVLFNNAQSQVFLFDVSHAPASITLDPDNWILKNSAGPLTPAQAGRTYGVSSGVLVTIDPASAGTTTVGTTGYSPMLNIRTHPVTSDLIGLAQTGSGSTLLLVSSSTGASAPLSTIPLTNLKGMTFHQDTLFVARLGSVYRIDVPTGAATLVTTVGIAIAGIDFHPVTGELWATVRGSDEVYTIDPSKGTTTLIGTTGLGTPTQDIMFDTEGNLFGLSGYGATGNSLILISTSSGKAAVIGTPDIVSAQGFGFGPSTGFTYAQFDLEAGWNLISLPAIIPNFTLSGRFPSATSRLFSYAGLYVQEDSMLNGYGYWLKSNRAMFQAYSGNAYDQDSVNVTAGWNLIGSVSSPISTSEISSDPPGMIVSPFYRYRSDSGKYVMSSTIMPASGYWVRTQDAGKLIFSTSSASLLPGRIRIVDNPELPPGAPEGGDLPFASTLPAAFMLGQNYPNPFNPTTVIHFELPREEHVTITLYSVLGEQVMTILDELRAPGRYDLYVGADRLSSGIYFYRCTAGTFSSTKKMILIR